ncbi:MAG: dihydropyrimidinase [Defluviitaleaceae bacterium]|nr:dihydropyrimidinase [Defluviitaleaceae bacterium]MCL2837246.1 dihydropyrimidinase [Defluviitaleaceae bacterium]
MLIADGLLVNENGTRKADVRVEGELIHEIGDSLVPRENERIINAAGKIIIPGGVDVHTHMDLDLGHIKAADDFYTGTAAAAFGGTTTIVDHMAFGPKGCSISHQAGAYHRLAHGNAVIDYGFHGVMGHVDDGILDELGTLINEGITSHKFYLTYDGKISDGEILRLMERASELGVMLAAHAENDGSIAYLREKYRSQGKTAPIYHARSRPPECEAEAVSRVAWLARMAGGAPLYIVHLSSGLALDCALAARKRGQKNLFIETCPQYLLLDESLYCREDGLKYIMNPPLRAAENRNALWEGVRNGDIDVIGTDHCPFFYAKEKQLGKGDFTNAPGGAPGVEARIPLMLAEVSAGRLTLERLVSLCCASPARLFGMYPKKGVIAAGSDADLVLIDPTVKTKLTHSMLHENCDYTPYEGLPLDGYPVMTISRGEVIVEGKRFTGRKGRGRFLKRGLPDLNDNVTG